jgi:uncharacterized protein (TIGR00369 family)
MDAAARLAMGQAVLQQQPFSRLLGAELTAWDGAHCTLELSLRQELLQQNGFAHGGVVSYLADNALTYVGAGTLQGAALTSEFKVNYVRPAVGERLIARAEAVATGATQAVCRCDVFVVKGGAEKLCAVAQGTIVKVAA